MNSNVDKYSITTGDTTWGTYATREQAEDAREVLVQEGNDKVKALLDQVTEAQEFLESLEIEEV